jgi:hypothetical protein
MFNFIKIILSLFCSSSSNKIQSKNRKSKRDKFSERCGKLGLSVALDIDIDNYEKSSENIFDDNINKKSKIWKVECDNWYSYSYKPGIVPLQSWFGFETVFSILNFRNKIR